MGGDENQRRYLLETFIDGHLEKKVTEKKNGEGKRIMGRHLKEEDREDPTPSYPGSLYKRTEDLEGVS